MDVMREVRMRFSARMYLTSFFFEVFKIKIQQNMRDPYIELAYETDRQTEIYWYYTHGLTADILNTSSSELQSFSSFLSSKLYNTLIRNMIWASSWENQQCGCAPSEDSGQPGHPPSLIRVFAVRMKKAWVLSYLLSAQRRLWADWVDAQVDLSLRWAHSHFSGLFTRRLIFK